MCIFLNVHYALEKHAILSSSFFRSLKCIDLNSYLKLSDKIYHSCFMTYRKNIPFQIYIGFKIR